MLQLKRLCCATLLAAMLATGTSAYAANGSVVQVTIHVGQDTATINGESSTIEKPYLQKGTPMIPISVITTAFGAQLQWDNQTQMITLTYGTTIMTLKAGSTQATLNGKPITLPVAPENKNGKTMLPIAVVTHLTGAKVSYDPAGTNIVITGASTQTSTAPTNSLDSDRGKSKIGDSFYGWSMKYPTGLIKNYQSYKGDYVNFKDSKETYWLHVSVDEKQPENLSKDGLVKKLTDGESDTILSKGYVSNEGKIPYAKSVTKDEEGNIYEHRAYQSGDKIFYVSLSVKKEEDYNNPAKNKAFKDLLDSFQPSYDNNDKTIKNLSNVENNYRWFNYDDFGLRIKVPAQWSKDERADHPIFWSEDKEQWMQIKISSKGEKDTLQDWVIQHENYYRGIYHPDYLKMDKESVSTTVAGVPALERKYTTTMYNQTSPEHDIYLFKGKYKFYIEVGYSNTDDPEKTKQLINTIRSSISINEQKMNPSLGELQDGFLIDPNAVATVKDTKYKYSIDIPEQWREMSYEDEGDDNNRGYVAQGLDFTIFATEVRASDMKKYIESDLLKDYRNKISENKSATIAGVSGYTIKLNYRSDNGPIEEQIYIVQKGNLTYVMIASYQEAAKSEATMKRIENVFQSFKFLD
ncbi:MAG: stalk domain-containing protein [Clostridia bacterium]